MADDRKAADRRMDAQRFAALADAYGGDLRRWPQAEQAAAAQFAQSAQGRAILERAGRLDATLEGYRIAAPSRVMHAGIVENAAAHLRQGRRQRWWWLGFGLAGIGLAGAVAGLALVTIVSPEVQPDHYVMDANATSFGDAGSDADAIEENL